MNRMDESMVPRRSLRIDLTPRERPFGLIGGSSTGLSLWAGAYPAVVLPLAFVVSVRVTIRFL